MTGAAQALPVLSEAIRQVRFDLGVSQEQFAARIYVSGRTVCLLETGRKGPETDELLRIGSLAGPGPAKTAIVEELRKRFRECPLVKVVA